MIGNKIAVKMRKASRRLPQNNPDTVESEIESIVFDREISKKDYISPAKRQ